MLILIPRTCNHLSFHPHFPVKMTEKARIFAQNWQKNLFLYSILTVDKQ